MVSGQPYRDRHFMLLSETTFRDALINQVLPSLILIGDLLLVGARSFSLPAPASLPAVLGNG